MNSINKKTSPMQRPPQPVRPQTRPAHQATPALAQLKSVVSAHRVMRPVAPPAYQPQPAPRVLQRKMATGVPNRQPPVAPPVYRPQPVPGVLQTKTSLPPNAHAGQAPRRPVAPPVYRPEAKKIVQPKAISAPRPTAASARAQALPKAQPHRPQAKPLSMPAKMPGSLCVRGIIQRSLFSAADFPPLGASVDNERSERIRQENLASVRLQRERDERERIAREARQDEIASLDRRETWWGLLHLTGGDATKRIRSGYSSIGGKAVHITVIKANTTNPNFRSDTVAEIVDKILGANNVLDSVHATLEQHGQDNAANPRYFRNGDHPNCVGNQDVLLGQELAAFVAEATGLATDKKAALLG